MIRFIGCLLGLAGGLCTAFAGPALDLSSAVIVSPADSGVVEKKAAQMVREEVEKRSQAQWTVVTSAPPGRAAIVLARLEQVASLARAAVPSLKSDFKGSEGYQLLTLEQGGAPLVVVAGNDARGVLFGAGRVLRLLDYARGSVGIEDGLRIATAPKYPLRGHQLGYRPKTNSYDAWDVAMWEQYVRDLAVFGTNAIELIPPRSDDDDDSPHFPLPQMRMMVEMSRLAGEYGMGCWIWYPAMDKDYSDAKTVEFALKEWGDVFRQLPHVDAVFVPGGDPGHTQPKYMMALLEKQTAVLHKYHPKAQMWMSPQSFSGAWLDEFYGIMRNEPTWLSGIVFGPQVRASLPELRRRIPKKYPIRFYPDITHSLRAQYPVPDWDVAYAVTENREVINPRPEDEATVFHLLQPLADAGFLTYSEGCNDDVNKIVWSGLGWNPDEKVADILRDYSRYFIGGPLIDPFAQGLLALERNWRGPVISNEGIFTTLRQFQQMERAATPQQKLNWRFQQALYRAYYDAYVRTRLIAETQQEQRAMAKLAEAKHVGWMSAVSAAERELEIPAVRPGAELRARVFELAEALFQSVRMQLSVERYQAIAIGRGANLDLIDFPLNNAPWLSRQFAEIRAMTSETDRLKRIDEIVNWTNPGPGGFYDDLGSSANQPHLVRGEGFRADPAFLKSALTGFGSRGERNVGWRLSWINHAEALNDEALEMAYHDLDPKARYRVRVVYGGDMSPTPIRLVANGKFEIHPFTPKESTPRPLEFDVPMDATASGELRLTWSKPVGLGGNGRGVQVCEVWLIRQ